MRRQHQKQLKQVFNLIFSFLFFIGILNQFEERCRNDKVELRSKLEREYNGFQEQINLDNNRLLDKHRRELADRVKYNQNCFKKFEREQEEDFDTEIKRFQQEQTKQYKNQKDIFKRV